MAPLPPFGKPRLLQWLRGTGKPPLWFGSPHPCACVVQQEGAWRLRDLAADPDTVRRASEEALRAGRPFMAEHAADLQAPTGKIHLEAPTREALATLVEELPWPARW